MITISQFSVQMARQGFNVRWIVLGSSPEDSMTSEEIDAKLAGFKGLEKLRYEVDMLPRPSRIACSRQDIFVATLFTTASYAAGYQAQMSTKRFLYFVQDYEAIFFPHSSMYALAIQSYTLPHFALFGTDFLRRYFERHGEGIYAPDGGGSLAGVSYENSISRDVLPTVPVLERKELNGWPSARRKLLVYLRTEAGNARNMWEMAMSGLSMAVRANTLDLTAWELHGIGSSVSKPRVFCGLARKNNACLTLLPLVPQKEYERFLLEYDIGIALMLSPHPSLVPMDFAAAGMITITNTWDTKQEEQLRLISKNILACKPTSAALAQRIADAMFLLTDLQSRVRNAALNWSSTWEDERSFGRRVGNAVRAW